MGTALKFVKLKSINQIPRYLLEQVKPREFDIDAVYLWGPTLIQNPLNLFGAFVDKNQTVKGTMWVSYSPMSNEVRVHVLSIDKEYFGRGILREAHGIVQKLRRQLGAAKISLVTTRPRSFEKFGFVRAKTIVMEK